MAAISGWPSPFQSAIVMVDTVLNSGCRGYRRHSPSGRQRHRRDPPQHASEQPPRLMTLSQQPRWSGNHSRARRRMNRESRQRYASLSLAILTAFDSLRSLVSFADRVALQGRRETTMKTMAFSPTIRARGPQNPPVAATVQVREWPGPKPTRWVNVRLASLKATLPQSDKVGSGLKRQSGL
jgi:hypothetical protein